MQILFVTTIYYTYQMAGKGSNTEIFKTVTGTECPWALDQSDSGKRLKPQRKGS